jgi:hypothetical protein
MEYTRRDALKVIGLGALGLAAGCSKNYFGEDLRPEDFEWGDKRLTQPRDTIDKYAREANSKYFGERFDPRELADVIEKKHNIKKHIVPLTVEMDIPISYKK